MSLIRLEGACRTYAMGRAQVHALHPTDLSIAVRDFVVFLGPSGSGKTTLLNLVAGLDSPSGGHVWVNDSDIAGLNRRGRLCYRRQAVGIVLQFHNLIPNLTARENVELAAELVGRQQAVDEALASVGLAARMHHFPHELSGGEQQRVAIARALVKNPPILLADEPTGNLDAATGKTILRLFAEIHARGVCILLVTHNAAIARIGTRVVGMRDGQIHSDESNPDPVPPDAIDW